MILSCSWCHHGQDLAISTFCDVCGHRADRARMDCDCEQCVEGLYRPYIDPEASYEPEREEEG